MKDLLAESSFDKLKEGQIVPGTITEIRQNEVVVDIGGKSEGLIPASEFIDIGELQIGSQIDVYVEKLEDKNGMPTLSYDKAEQKKNWDNILTRFPEGSIASGRVRAKVKGGLIVSIGVDSFLPASHIDVQPPKNLDQYVGQTYDFKVLKINLDRKNIVLSRRELIEEQRTSKRRALLESIEPGQVRKGVVKNITDFGAFIDLDGMDGLLHITDMSWGRITHPSEMLKQGEEIQVMIIEVNRDKERVSLGLKQTTKNPWDDIEQKFPVGAKVHGKVVNLVPYGAFIEIEPGVEGLVHITEMSWTKRITKPSELLKVGQELDAVVLGIQKDEQKISLGLRQLEANPWEMVRHNYPIGARVHGKVRNMTTYGAFIELEEGIDGMVHVSDMSWTRKVNHPSEMLKKGDEVDAIVLDVDPSQQRISLGMKQLSTDPWADIDAHFKIGDVVTGVVTKITSFGAFVELKDGIDGLVHISQISEDRIEKVKDVLKPGQEVTARVIKIDTAERRLGLSIKAANYSAEQLASETATLEALTRDSSGDMMNLGDILDAASGDKEKSAE
ncbi:small subunit ribosomal protein S1 [Ereboglobus sp. PH5-5]|uniref:30S ribosomal protein S1 n=1 Tax=unclassified Ereboglobus TaxID=2626932 RepID=UPI002404E41B|nr:MULTISPECIES: 30S ribosomal protein S1 [unclassified Ereboglobus]MDF9826177.1 small subunit ribosomal protein S1 [Ereboglobus sp. PH5-10]MDF9832194.1 small subunit ribosomal protein S1 [Ereboglobus sp. PH5-5]